MNFEKMTKEELIEYINSLGEELNGKYGIVWDKEKEPEKIVVDCDKYIPILKEIKEKNINNDAPNNILVEGDNFHSLSVLNYTHKEAIDIIYIDPPYNTGKEDEWMYNDKYVDIEDGYRHSKWLNFMEKRLKLARNLLKEKGLIFISIGDDEFAQLKLLCDKVFGERNFITNFIWIQTTNPPSLGKIRNNMEYVLCYQKQSNSLKLYGRSSNEKDSPLANGSNNIVRVTIPKGSCHFTNVEGSLKVLKGEKKSGVILHDDINVKDQLNENDFDIEFHSKWGQDNINVEIKKGSFFIVKDYEYFSIRYQKGSIGYVVPDKFLDPTKFDVKDNEFGRKQLEALIGKNKFPYPKNTPLIKTLINMYGIEKKDITVLDFFAGSGTTGQAVLELNKKDKGNRKFILCTNNENGICENVTYQRIKNSICGCKNFESLGGALRYYKTEFVDYAGTRDQLYYDLTEKCIPMLCVKSDTYELIEKNKEYIIYSNKDKTDYSCVYFDIFGESYDKFIEKVKNIKEHKNLYIFSLSEYVNEENFKGISNYNIEPIPYKILNLYKNVVKMSKEN